MFYCRSLRRAFLALLSSLCLPLTAAPAKPNILFLLSDDHSYPYLSC